MNPGRIRGVVKVSPLKRLSPSRLFGIERCALREVWAADKVPALLPSSPKARLGTVIHSLLELAGRGQLGRTPDMQIDQTWTRLVSECETQMSNSWLERSLVPLSKSVPDFEVRRLRARRIAVLIAAASDSFARIPKPAPGIGFEVWVETPDHLIGGRIDEVRTSVDGLKLRDYKTGQILETETVEGSLAVKMEYQTQLRLYAALYASSFGRWPSHLEIVDLDGREFSVPCEPAKCEVLLQEARKVLNAVNKRIQGSKSIEETIRNLAKPAPPNCTGCLYRPGCPAYRTTRDASTSTDWPKDIFGIVQYVRRLASGRVSLGVNTATGPTMLTRIRNLEPTESRHPALGFLKEGDQVGIFNLKGNPPTTDFSESPMTAIYHLESI